jgi:hypothetical protein
MRDDTRQTILGLIGLTAVQLVALHEGFNGRVTTAYFIAVIALVAPETLDQLPFN